MTDLFPPTRSAALARLAAVRPTAYASSRNNLDGAVTRLSPYLTHGLLTLPEVAATLAARHPLPMEHKLVKELGWREFFHHVWQYRGDGILASLHEGPKPESVYRATLPEDIRLGCTGVPLVDRAVRQLYATGWLHNHARMWLASYVVHLRGVHWRAGADWMVAHLLDGDLASNHLSWQWIAGTGSHKPYLFNAENVARYAGREPGWASPGSVVDTDYATLEDWARGAAPLPAAPPAPGTGRAPAVDEPATGHVLPAGIAAPAPLPSAAALAGREVWLVHPWSLAGVPGDPGGPSEPLRLGVWPAEFHARWAWSAARWRFVAGRLIPASQQVVWADSAALKRVLAGASSVRCIDNPHLPAAWPAAWRQPAPRLLPDPGRLYPSFSQFWRQVTRGMERVVAGAPGMSAAAQPGLFED